MIKRYRAVPLDILYAQHLEEHGFAASGDGDAVERAKHHFGPDTPFALWEGDRHALTHRPAAPVPTAPLRFRDAVAR